MRLWSIHPKYLDRIGLIALWRESLLAKKVLLGETKGYTNHPQLIRFKGAEDPLLAINTYLYFIHQEAQEREYNFNSDKLGKVDINLKLNVTSGQINYEFKHLLKKLESRDLGKFKRNSGVKIVFSHPLFNLIKGKIESWERV